MDTAALLRRIGQHVPRFSAVTDSPPVGPDSWAHYTAHDGADHNMALIATADDLRVALDALGTRAALLLVPGDAPADLAAALAAAGLTAAGTAPLMVRALDASFDRHDDVRRATDLDDTAALIEAGFAVDHAGLHPDIPARDDVIAWTIHDDDVAVSTVVTTHDADLVGIFCMATPPAHARRGHGRRLLSHALAHHAAEDVATAYLVATPAGEPLYRSLGFETVAELDIWVAGTSTQFP
jgi:ribosomal protein S18 acetylase RimI-like enzyme